MIFPIILLAAIGFILSIYAFYVEEKAVRHKWYKAACDINENISCTRAFTSRYGELFGFSNAILGIVFYFTIALLAFYDKIDIILILSIICVLVSIYLAYISYYKMRNFCLVCTSIYLINLLIFVFSLLEIL